MTKIEIKVINTLIVKVSIKVLFTFINMLIVLRKLSYKNAKTNGTLNLMVYWQNIYLYK